MPNKDHDMPNANYLPERSTYVEVTNGIDTKRQSKRLPSANHDMKRTVVKKKKKKKKYIEKSSIAHNSLGIMASASSEKPGKPTHATKKREWGMRVKKKNTRKKVAVRPKNLTLQQYEAQR